MRDRLLSGAYALACLALLAAWSLQAPEHLGAGRPEWAFAKPWELPPLGADGRGRPLVAYAMQGASVVALPSLVAGLVVAACAVAGGLLTTTGSARVASALQAAGEIVGALPRMVVVLVVALVVPRDARGLMPLAVTWAVLAAPGAADEAAAVVSRLGGARFVEALRAHGYGRWRIYGVHVVAYNLRPVVVRQAAEITMQTVFLEIALSYLALAEHLPSLTHPDSTRSWADLLDMGYLAIVTGRPSGHALALGLLLVAMVATMTLAIGHAARAR